MTEGRLDVGARTLRHRLESSDWTPPADHGSRRRPVAGLGVFVLAEVFAHGARLRADVEGTV